MMTFNTTRLISQVVFVIMCLLLEKCFQNIIISLSLSLLLSLYSFLPLFFYYYTRVLGERYFMSWYTCVYGHSPQELRCAPRNRSVVVSPLGHYAKGERRVGKTIRGGTTRRDGVMERSGNAFLVLRLGSKSLSAWQ